MKQINWITLYITIVYLSTITICFSSENNAIAYKLDGGRFGDNILQYCKTKWCSFIYDIPLVYRPFQHSNKLAMHQLEKLKYTQGIEKQFKYIVNLKEDIPNINVNAVSQTLFIKNSYTQGIIKTKPDYIVYEYMIQYPQFGDELKKMLQPIIPVTKLNLPTDKITVAVHIRKGSGPDKPLASVQQYNNHEQLVMYEEQLLIGKRYFFADKVWPTKFPPEQYYIDQIKKLSSLLNDAPLFVYIFTDAKNPITLVKKFEKIINKPNITFACKESGIFNYQYHIIDDYYNMAQFDCLIRSTSHFGLAAQMLGDHKIIIHPQHARWINNKIVVDKVGIIIRQPYADTFKYFLMDNILRYKKELISYAKTSLGLK